MKSFSKLYSDFWINPDNTELMQLGIDAKLMALYLQGNSHHNMLGIYYLPILYVASDLKQSAKKVQSALKKLCDISYCKYDEKTQYIWVCNMVLEQLGEDIDVKDNRVKAIQAIWNSLPIKINFLTDVYSRYHSIFHLEPRFTDFLNNKINNLTEIKKVETQQSINTAADINNSTGLNNVYSDKEPSIDVHHASIPPSIKVLPTFIPTFEGGVVNNQPLQGPPMVESAYNFETNILATIQETNVGTYLVDNHLDISTATKNSLDPSKGLPASFEASSKVLQSHLEAPSEALRSNIEYISKNIEERSKKEEVDLKKIEKEEKKEINLSNVLTPNIVAQARPCVIKLPEFNFSEAEFSEITAEANNPTSAISLTAEETSKMSVSIVSTNPVTALANAVASIFEHWKITLGHPKAKLDEKRKKLIRGALKMGYTVQELCEAVTGCSLTPHNTGANDQHQRYDGLHIILGDADQIDRFVRNFHHPPKKETEAQKRSRINIQVAKEWAEQKSRSNYV